MRDWLALKKNKYIPNVDLIPFGFGLLLIAMSGIGLLCVADVIHQGNEMFPSGRPAAALHY